jgi:hypothetical protein
MERFLQYEYGAAIVVLLTVILAAFAGFTQQGTELPASGNGSFFGTLQSGPEEWVFTPTSRTYSNLDSNQSDQDFLATSTIVCENSSASWQNHSVENQTGSFVAAFDATPSQTNMDGVVGMSTQAGNAYSDFAVLVRFNSNGIIDARNGSSYATSTIPYVASNAYHFRLAVNVPAHQYDAWVTPEGGIEQVLANDFSFRTEQAGISSISNWGFITNPGTLQVCDFIVTNEPGSLTANAGQDKTIIPGGSTTLDGSSSGGTSPYTYSWIPATGLNNPSIATPTASPTSTTTYTLTVTDSSTPTPATATDTVTVTVQPPTASLTVTPATGLSSSGNQGGPFTPNSTIYTLTNNGTASLNWTASKTQNWVSLSSASGTLAAGANTTVTVSINSNANSLSAGNYSDTVSFTNTTNGNGNTTRNVSLNISSPGQGDITPLSLGNLTIPRERIPDWTNAGVDGGIPDTSNATEWPVINATAYGANPACDSGDDHVAIQNAVNAASAMYGDGRKGTIVYLPGGCYEWDKYTISMKSNVVLKGAGQDVTILTGLMNGGTVDPEAIQIYGSEGTTISVTDGAIRNSLQLTLANTPSFSSGTYLIIREDMDPQKFDRPNGSPYSSQVIRVTSINGNQISLDRPLRDSFTLNPRVIVMNPIQNAGVEDLTVQFPTTIDQSMGYRGLIRIRDAVNSWIKNVHFYWGDNMHLEILKSRNLTIESCKFEKLDYTEPAIEGGYGGRWNSGSIYASEGLTDSLIWNNIFSEIEVGIKYENGPIGNVFAYNYVYDLMVNHRATFLHGGYPSEILFEGNSIFDGQFEADTFWGKQGPRNVWFRNRALGGTSGYSGFTAHKDTGNSMGDLHSFIGNVGEGIYGYPCGSEPDCIYRFDGYRTNLWAEKNRYTNLFIRYNDQPTTTYVPEIGVCPQNEPLCAGFSGPRLRTCNGDCYETTGYNGRQPPSAWSGFSIPASLFLTSRPSFWCQEIPWPAVGADIDNLDNLTKIPAQRRYEGLPCTPVA